MSWLLIVIAGVLEAGWAVGLKYTEGFTRLVPSVFTIAAIIASMFLLGLGARTLPIGTAYAVWVGIGTVGAAIIGIVKLGEPATPARIFFLVLLVVAVVGLKLATPNAPPADAPPNASGGIPASAKPGRLSDGVALAEPTASHPG